MQPGAAESPSFGIQKFKGAGDYPKRVFRTGVTINSRDPEGVTLNGRGPQTVPKYRVRAKKGALKLTTKTAKSFSWMTESRKVIFFFKSLPTTVGALN